MVGPRLVIKPAARPAIKRGVGSTPHPKVQQFKTQSGAIIVHSPYQKSGPAEADLTKYQGNPQESINSCANIFSDGPIIRKSISQLEKIEIQIAISQFFASLWEVDSWGLDTILAGILETQQPIIQFSSAITNGSKQVLISSLPPLKSKSIQLSEDDKTFQDPPSGTRQYTAKEIVDAIEKAGGKIKIAATALGISRQAIYKRIGEAPPNSPLAQHKDRKRIGKRAYSDTEIATVLNITKGNRTYASQVLGQSTDYLNHRIGQANEHSPLKPFAREERGRPPKFTDIEIAQAIEEASGNKEEAAKKLGISRETIYKRIRAASKDSPLVKHQYVKRGPKPKHSDKAIAAAPDQANDDVKVAARKFRTPKHTDTEIAQAIEDAGGDKIAAAKKLGIGQTTVYRRINQSEPGTPLSLHKRQISDVNFLSDRDIAIRLSEHDGDLAATARSLWVHPDAIHIRIIFAKETSPLVEFKKGLKK